MSRWWALGLVPVALAVGALVSGAGAPAPVRPASGQVKAAYCEAHGPGTYTVQGQTFGCAVATPAP